MASFLEKLKRGMDVKETSDINNNQSPTPEEPVLPSKQDKPTSSNEVEEEETKTEELTGEQPTKEITPVLASTFSLIGAAKSKKKKKSPKNKKEKVKKSKTEKIEIKEEEVRPEKKKARIQEKKWFEPEGQLVVDVYQTDDEVVIQSAIAGIRPEDLDISIEKDVVTIRGKREKTFEKREPNYFYQECYWGAFSREIILPVEVDGKRAQATMKSGILTIRMPKIEREGRKKIAVKG